MPLCDVVTQAESPTERNSVMFWGLGGCRKHAVIGHMLQLLELSEAEYQLRSQGAADWIYADVAQALNVTADQLALAGDCVWDRTDCRAFFDAHGCMRDTAPCVAERRRLANLQQYHQGLELTHDDLQFLLASPPPMLVLLKNRIKEKK